MEYSTEAIALPKDIGVGLFRDVGRAGFEGNFVVWQLKLSLNLPLRMADIEEAIANIVRLA
ncbi:MAG: hypothetical protein F6K47_29290 [Symploca sp. SIO2E6]|nr:hypothetical protein [Symploca sp. SIO2E6]